MTKGHKETFGGDGYVYCHDCAGGFLKADICQNSPKCTLESGPIIADLLYLNKVVKKKKKIIARQWDQCSNGETQEGGRGMGEGLIG